MVLTRYNILILVAAGGSAALLLGALAFQYIGGLAPCALCIWQRWPHLVAVLLGALGLFVGGGRLIPVLGGLAALTSAGIGVFHVGVEQKWWEGLASCSAGSISGVSTADLLNPAVDVAQVVRCDEIPWQMLGVSMAGWNVLASVVLAMIWFALARRP
jgi:disulfide bond formation protein DsbB